MSIDYSFLFGADSESESGNIGPEHVEECAGPRLVSLLAGQHRLQQYFPPKLKVNFCEIIPSSSKVLENLKLPKEVEKGKYEYKFKLSRIDNGRLQHLVTQLKWRLEEGNGEAVYELGVSDAGNLIGLTMEDLDDTLSTISKMTELIGATITSGFLLKCLTKGKNHATLWVSEVTIRCALPSLHAKISRFFCMGLIGAGKTTLISVLTRGQLDDGNGLVRVCLFNHLHEIKSGHSSSLSYEIIGFDQHGEVLNYTNRSNKAEVCHSSSHLVTFIDSCGSPRYIGTTLFGLTSNLPHCILNVIDPSKSLFIDENVKGFLDIILSWNVNSIICLSHMDLCSDDMIDSYILSISSYVRTNSRLKVICIKSMDNFYKAQAQIKSKCLIPIVPYSSVTGSNIHILVELIRFVSSVALETEQPTDVMGPTEFQINFAHNIPETGPVVSGILLRGHLKVSDRLFLGPVGDDGGSVPVIVTSLQRYHTNCNLVLPGQLASAALSFLSDSRPPIKKGAFLLIEDCAEFSLSLIAKLHINKSFPTSLIGATGILYISNFYSPAILGLYDYVEGNNTVVTKEHTVMFSFIKNKHYVKSGAKLVFICNSHKLTGLVVNPK